MLGSSSLALDYPAHQESRFLLWHGSQWYGSVFPSCPANLTHKQIAENSRHPQETVGPPE